MQDDDKQPSYERLDESQPERNRRSFFDWLRGKEETEEERLRKKLDEELKEAARQRAEQFEEERRVEEQREVSETKKLKKRWRAKLVEKSKKMLDDAALSGEEPTSGYDIARIMVAERIVKLHDMLEDDSLDLRRSEVKSLKIHIDFMGLLSEKLDRPELEVPAEIEQLYQTITASVEETTGEVTPRIDETPPEAAPVSDTDAAYNAFAASIVHAIRRTLRPDESLSPELTQRNPETRLGTGIEQPPKRPDLAEALLTAVQEAALTGEAIRKELSQVDKARHLADVVEKAAMHEEPPIRMRRQASGGTTLTIPVPLPAERGPLHSEHGFDLPPNKKIKYLSDLELFTLAKTVEIGSGRLLSDVYTQGEIDREGLIKVLEKYNKGEDFRSELVLRRDSWRRHKDNSAEYLTTPSTPQSAPVVSPRPETTKRRLASFGSRVASLASAPIAQSHLRDIGGETSAKKSGEIGSKAQLAHDIKTRLTRQSQVAVLAASILLVVVIFFVVIELNTR